MKASFTFQKRCNMSIAVILCIVLLCSAVSAQTNAKVLITGKVVKHQTECDIYGKDHVKKPVAFFDFIPKNGFTPLIVTFKDRSVRNATSWNWSFDDGTFSTMQNPPPHTYTKMGGYRVLLTAKNCAGESKMTRYVWVLPKWWWMK